jgi:hypothetical protein
MLKDLFLTAVALALCSTFVAAQDNGEQMIKKALLDREVMLKMDLPAVNTGITMTFDDANVSFDQGSYEKLLKEYGSALSKNTKARITDVRVSAHGIEIDLNGGGLPQRDWMVGGFRLETPTPLAKSNREVELERQVQTESNLMVLNSLRSDLDSERSARVAQDAQNQAEFQRVSQLRSDYIETNRKNWGSKIIVVVHSRKSSVHMRDMVQSLAKYVELLPREPATASQ